jgi:hypothetical protein
VEVAEHADADARNRFIVAFIWLWDYVTFQRGARLIIDVSGGEPNPPYG